MAPRPYCDKSSLPNNSGDSISAIPTQMLPESPSPSTVSGGTTPSPSLEEVIPTESFVDSVCDQEDNSRVMISPAPCYPTPGDIMPYDHSLPDFIRQITNQQNLANLQSLSLRVISTLISLHRMTTYLPNLRELDLEGSVLNSLRDIGCNLKNLQVLKVGRCQLESLDGTFGLASLRELYAQKNFIKDISPCSNLPHIRHIDVSGNRIRNISFAGFLSVCTKLRSIVFTGNPATEVSDYRKHVRRIVPQIQTLDGIPFFNEDNTEELKEAEMIENFCEGSDSGSMELPDFSVSPSESLNNFLEFEEESVAMDKRNKHAKNVANQDQLEAADHEVQEVLTKCGLHDDFQSIDLHQNRAKKGILEQPNFIENRNIKQKSTSIQKLDKDIENRSKKSNILLKNVKINQEQIIEGLNIAVPSTSCTILEDNSFQGGNGNSLIDVPDTEVKIDEKNNGAVKKTSLTQDHEDVICRWGASKLSKGLPVCGNLTAALRNRKKIQNVFEEKEAVLIKNTQTLGEEESKSLHISVHGGGDNSDPDSIIDEDNIIAEDVLESSQKWREAFRRYRSNNRRKWEEEEEEESKSLGML